MSTQEILQEGLEAARAGNVERAARLFAQAVQSDANSEMGWYYLGLYRSNPKEREFCFRRVLAINPSNREAQQQLALLQKPASPPPQPVRPVETPKITPPAVRPEPSLPPEPKPIQPSKTFSAYPSLSTTRAPVEPAQAAIIREPEPQKPVRKKRSGSWAGMLLLVILLGIMGGIAWFMMRSESFLAAPASPSAGSPSPGVTQAATPASSYTAVFQSSDCPVSLPEGMVAECGFVTVPEDRTGDLQDTIRLAVIRYRSQAQTPRSDPMVLLQAGPGREALQWSIDHYNAVILPFLDTREFIVFDPRGSGHSQPELKCDDFMRTYFLDLQGWVPTSEREESYKGALFICKNNLLQAGVNPSAYTTMDMAADVKDVVAALGYAQANLYSISHGTRVAQMVMKNQPGLVQAAVLDSAIPLELQQTDFSANQGHDNLSQLFDQCAAQAACQAAFPELRRDYERAIQQLNSNPVVLSIPVEQGLQFAQKVDGVAFSDAVRWALRTSQTIPLTPLLIHKAAAGDYSLLSFVLSIPLQTYDSINMGVYLSVNCHDELFSLTTESLDTAVANMCPLWVTRPLEAGENELPVSGIPSLLISGQYDSVTPASYAEQLGQKLTGSHIVVIPDQGNAPTASGVSDCPMRVVRAFVDSPFQAPDPSCVQQTVGVSFVVLFTLDTPVEFFESQDDEWKLVTRFPQGWVETGQQQYDRKNSFIDNTQVSVQKSAVSEKEWLGIVVRNFESLGGLDTFPVKTQSMSFNELEWNFYESSLLGQPVDLAFARSEPNTLMVIMLSSADEREALFQKIFLPIVEGTRSLD